MHWTTRLAVTSKNKVVIIILVLVLIFVVVIVFFLVVAVAVDGIVNVVVGIDESSSSLLESTLPCWNTPPHCQKGILTHLTSLPIRGYPTQRSSPAILVIAVVLVMAEARSLNPPLLLCQNVSNHKVAC